MSGWKTPGGNAVLPSGLILGIGNGNTPGAPSRGQPAGSFTHTPDYRTAASVGSGDVLIAENNNLGSGWSGSSSGGGTSWAQDSFLIICSGNLVDAQSPNGTDGGSNIIDTSGIVVTHFSLIVNNQTVNQSDPENPIAYSIPFAPAHEMLANPDDLRVAHMDELGNVTIIPGGIYNTETGTVDFTTNLIGTFLVGYAR